MTALSDKFHLIAPDYPGFGFSAFPDKGSFEYTFKNISEYDLKSLAIPGIFSRGWIFQCTIILSLDFVRI